MSVKTENLKGLFANPKSRMVIIVMIIVLIVAILSGLAMFKRKAVPPQLKPEIGLGQAPNLGSAPGATDNQKYVEASDSKNNSKFDEANKTGGSALPTPVQLTDDSKTIGTGTSVLGGPGKVKEDEKPVLPKVATDVVTPPAPPVIQSPQPARYQQQYPSSYGVTNGKQLDVLLERWAPTGQSMETDFTGNGGRGVGVASTSNSSTNNNNFASVNGNGGSRVSLVQAGAQTTNQPINQSLNTTTNQQTNYKQVNVTAGTFYSAVLITGIDTDEPGPVLAEIVEGPFAGARLIGSVTSGSTQTSEKTTTAFTVMTAKGAPSSTSIKAFAVNQETVRAGLATEVDRHYLERYGLLFAASFMNGFGTALASAGTTTVTNAAGIATTTNQARTLSNLLDVQEMGTIALGNVGKEVSKALAQNVTRPVTVRVAPQTPIAVLFMQDAAVTIK